MNLRHFSWPQSNLYHCPLWFSLSEKGFSSPSYFLSRSWVPKLVSHLARRSLSLSCMSSQPQDWKLNSRRVSLESLEGSWMWAESTSQVLLALFRPGVCILLSYEHSAISGHAFVICIKWMHVSIGPTFWTFYVKNPCWRMFYIVTLSTSTF